MEPCFLALAAILPFLDTGVSSLQCYQCFINPPPGQYYNTTKRLCQNFDYSDDFIVDCPYSTMCVKQDFHLDIQNGDRIDGTLRDCALQKYEYQDLENGQWSPKIEIMEPYREGCEDVDDKGERTTPTRYCYCKSNLCNSSPNTNHEGYTDIMGVIVVFNLMKYINSLR
ncbi:uncharacterized protein LOC113226043 [Hyposmocoma kahamanoa]|uniref:uncharacterized protein LOC113226043 n=1 Tax=Hyposmocoma kahamanoa TaxID=1477025 RepID=UPI000E6D65A6|nr:uncharacterized protein LOC113226043 [Hyposmocoma kahamanoa]